MKIHIQSKGRGAADIYLNSRKTPAFRHEDIRLQVPWDAREFTLGESM